MKNTNNLNSVCFYDNAETQKAVIFKENRGKSGVYRWTNKVNGKSYIGRPTFNVDFINIIHSKILKLN